MTQHFDMDPIMDIKTNGLTFSYQEKYPILKNISICVPQKSIYGFIGPNGAGKSTTMRLLTGLINYEKDNIEILGKPLSQQIPTVFKDIGTMIESPALYLHLTARENLSLYANIHGVSKERIDEVLAIIGLSETHKKKVKHFSMGMKQRLAIGTAILHKPKLLLLDEPVNGLDPGGIVEVRQLLMKLNKDFGTTIFISSHLLNEVEKMCSHIGIIHKGEMKFQGTIQELYQLGNTEQLIVKVDGADQIVAKLAGYMNATAKNNETIEVSVTTKNEISNLVKKLVSLDANIYQIQSKGGLEEWFMNITEN